MSTPSGSSDRIISLASWATTRPPGPEARPPVRPRTRGSPEQRSGRPPASGPMWTDGRRSGPASGRRTRRRGSGRPAASDPGPPASGRTRPRYRSTAAAAANTASRAASGVAGVRGTTTAGVGQPGRRLPDARRTARPASPPATAVRRRRDRRGRRRPAGPSAPSSIRVDEPGPHRTQLELVEGLPGLSRSQPPRASSSTWTSRGTSRTSGITSALIRTCSGVVGQVLAQLGRQGVEVGEDGVEVAVLVDQFGRRLLPHPGHPGEVVGRVAAEGGQERVLLGPHPGALLDARLVVEGVVAHPPPVVEHPDVGVLDQLVGVAVAGDDDDRVLAVPGLGGQGGQHVVGLEPLGPRSPGWPASRAADRIMSNWCGRSGGVSARPPL